MSGPEPALHHYNRTLAIAHTPAPPCACTLKAYWIDTDMQDQEEEEEGKEERGKRRRMTVEGVVVAVVVAVAVVLGCLAHGVIC